MSCQRVGKTDPVAMHIKQSVSQYFDLHHGAAKTKLLQNESFSSLCQKLAHGKENRKGVVEKKVDPSVKSLLDILFVSFKSVEGSPS